MSTYFFEMRYGGTCGTSAFTAGVCAMLDELGISHIGTEAADGPAIADAIRMESPDLVLTCPRFPSMQLLGVIPANMHVRFGMRTVSNANMMAYQHEWPLVCGWLDLMHRCPNMYLLPNTEDMVMLAQAVHPELAERIMHFPNVYPKDMRPREDTKQHSDVRIGFAGRPCYSKNIAATSVALAAIHQQQPAHTFVWTPLQKAPDQCKHAQAFSVLANCVTFMPWTHDFRHIAEALSLDVAVALSTTESFGYAALDFLSLGVPVVGSRALRFLPKAWQVVDESNPTEIASKIADVLTVPRAQAACAAYRAFTRVTQGNRHIACKTLQALLS